MQICIHVRDTYIKYTAGFYFVYLNVHFYVREKIERMQVIYCEPPAVALLPAKFVTGVSFESGLYRFATSVVILPPRRDCRNRIAFSSRTSVAPARFRFLCRRNSSDYWRGRGSNRTFLWYARARYFIKIRGTLSHKNTLVFLKKFSDK